VREVDQLIPKSLYPSTSGNTYWQVETESSLLNGASVSLSLLFAALFFIYILTVSDKHDVVDTAGNVTYDLDLLHCALSLAAQCIVIGPVCGFATGGRAGGRAVPVTTITRNCVHRFSPNLVRG